MESTYYSCFVNNVKLWKAIIFYNPSGNRWEFHLDFHFIFKVALSIMCCIMYFNLHENFLHQNNKTAAPFVLMV